MRQAFGKFLLMEDREDVTRHQSLTAPSPAAGRLVHIGKLSTIRNKDIFSLKRPIRIKCKMSPECTSFLLFNH